MRAGIGSDAEGDSLLNIDHLVGSQFGDRLSGGNRQKFSTAGRATIPCWPGAPIRWWAAQALIRRTIRRAVPGLAWRSTAR